MTIRSGPARAIVVGTLALVVLLGASVGIAIWRYEVAIGKKNEALTARAEGLRAQQAETAFWRAREAINEYIASADPSVLPEITAQRAAFASATAGLGADV